MATLVSQGVCSAMLKARSRNPCESKGSDPDCPLPGLFLRGTPYILDNLVSGKKKKKKKKKKTIFSKRREKGNSVDWCKQTISPEHAPGSWQQTPATPFVQFVCVLLMLACFLLPIGSMLGCWFFQNACESRRGVPHSWCHVGCINHSGPS